MSQIKEHLKVAVRDLLDDGFEPDELTVRQIAYEAHVATGIINYHYGSKNNLIVEVISSIIQEATENYFLELSQTEDTPREQLMNFLKAIIHVVLRFRKYSEYIIREEFTSNSFNTPIIIHGLLKAVKPDLDERDIRILAIQVVAPLQYMFLKEEGLKQYLDSETASREQFDVSDYEAVLEKVVNALGI